MEKWKNVYLKKMLRIKAEEHSVNAQSSPIDSMRIWNIKLKIKRRVYTLWLPPTNLTRRTYIAESTHVWVDLPEGRKFLAWNSTGPKEKSEDLSVQVLWVPGWLEAGKGIPYPSYPKRLMRPLTVRKSGSSNFLQARVRWTRRLT